MSETSEKVPVKKGEASAENRASEWHPLVSLRDEIDRVFDRFSHGWPHVGELFHRPTQLHPFEDWPAAFRPGSQPSVDVTESSKAYEITAELPGLDEKDIDVTVSNGRLVLKAEKKAEREQEEKDFYVKERRFGTFQRAFMVPPDADEKKVTAKYRKGVLSVKLPKAANGGPKEKKIRVSAE